MAISSRAPAAPRQRPSARRPAALTCVTLLVCLGGRHTKPLSAQAQRAQAGGGGGRWDAGDNVRAAIDHYGPRIRAHDASADDYRHLVTALRFAGRLEECAAVLHRGLTHVPAIATGGNYFLLANMLRAVGRPRDAAGMYQMAIVAEPLAANYYMQLGMTLQFHNMSGEHGRPREAMYDLAVRLSADGDEVWMQSSLLHVTSLLGKVSAATSTSPACPAALSEGLNRYRRLIAFTDAAWLRWSHALAINLPLHCLQRYSRRLSKTRREEAEKGESGGGALASHHNPMDGGVLSGELGAVLDALQNPSSCSAARAVVFQLEDNIFGLGAQIHLLSLVAAYAFHTGRTLLAAEQDRWWYAGDDCPSGSFHCYFKPLSSCSVQGPHGVLVARGDGGGGGVNIKKLRLLGEHDEQRDRVVLANVQSEGWLKTAGYRRAVPPQFASMGLLWWRTQLIKRIFQPQAHVLAHAHTVANQMQWPEPWGNRREGRTRGGADRAGGGGGIGDDGVRARIVGVHMRHGDKVMEEAPRIPLAHYIQSIRNTLADIDAPAGGQEHRGGLGREGGGGGGACSWPQIRSRVCLSWWRWHRILRLWQCE
jgi:hypothetical protein